MTAHPLIDFSGQSEVRQVKGFPAAAAQLEIDALLAMWEAELAAAPRRADAGKKYLVGHDGSVATGRRTPRDEELLAAALWRRDRDAGAGLPLPGTDRVDWIDYAVPARARREDTGPTELPLLGIGPDERLVVALLKHVPPTATRTSGETPLRLLVEGLALTAVAAANREAIASELVAAGGRTISDAPPMLFVLPTARYWELCRKRGPQRGAHWIKELDRLARELDERTGVTVRYLGLRLAGEPVFELRDDGPVLVTEARLVPAWESTAGRVRPKARPKPRSQPAETVVEADPDRPPRPYAISESYSAGDTIDHPTLGRGVVQGVGGPGKIQVLFEEKRSMLVHERERR